MNEAKKKTRRRYDAELKQQILAQCTKPDASVANIALWGCGRKLGLVKERLQNLLAGTVNATLKP